MKTPNNLGLIYLATVYSSHPDGIENAFIQASKITARLLKSGIKVYSPIVQTHPIAVHGNVDPYDHSIWMPFDEAMMQACNVLVIATMSNWQNSKGITHEIAFFERSGKPIFLIDPETLEFSSYKGFKERGWVGVDLDGTLARCVGWTHWATIGDPIWPMVERVKGWLREGKRVKIMTARVSEPFVDCTETEMRQRISDWCLEHIGERLEITSQKDHDMIELWDDRAVQVEPNIGEPTTFWVSCLQ